MVFPNFFQFKSEFFSMEFMIWATVSSQSSFGWLYRASALIAEESFLIFSCYSLELCISEAEDIKKRWQEYTEELYKKDLHDLDNHSGVITHLEADILDNEVKKALGNITMNKTSRGDRILVELFQILKDVMQTWALNKRLYMEMART